MVVADDHVAKNQVVTVVGLNRTTTAQKVVAIGQCDSTHGECDSIAYGDQLGGASAVDSGRCHTCSRLNRHVLGDGEATDVACIAS